VLLLLIVKRLVVYWCYGAVYTAGGDAIVRGYNARSGTLQCQFIGHDYCVNLIAVCISLLQHSIASCRIVSSLNFSQHLSYCLSTDFQEYKFSKLF